MKANTQEKAQVAFWVTPVLHTGHDSCEHCLSNTGIHWPRTCRFSYLGYLASELRVCLPLTPSARITDMFHHAQLFKKCAVWGQNSIACVFKVSTLPNEPFLLVPFWKWRPIQSLPTLCPRCKRWGQLWSRNKAHSSGCHETMGDVQPAHNGSLRVGQLEQPLSEGNELWFLLSSFRVFSHFDYLSGIIGGGIIGGFHLSIPGWWWRTGLVLLFPLLPILMWHQPVWQ